ncbi:MULTISPECIES: hypothetical protein [unclassified Nonomuraea]
MTGIRHLIAAGGGLLLNVWPRWCCSLLDALVHGRPDVAVVDVRLPPR